MVVSAHPRPLPNGGAGKEEEGEEEAVPGASRGPVPPLDVLEESGSLPDPAFVIKNSSFLALEHEGDYNMNQQQKEVKR